MGSMPAPLPSSAALQPPQVFTPVQVRPASAGAPGPIWPPLPGYSSSLPTLRSPARGQNLEVLDPGPIASPDLCPQRLGAPSPAAPAVTGAQPTRPRPRTGKLRASCP